MKKIFLFLAAFGCMLSSFASVIPASDLPRNASELYVPVGKSGKSISLKELSQISVSDFEKLTGENMKFMQKMAFKKGQKKLRKQIQPDGTLTEKGYRKLAPYFGGETGFHLGGFALGFFLGALGLLLAYLAFKDDYQKNRIKWAWIGFGIALVLNIILIVVVLSNADDVTYP
jgi:hypothetical protein